MWALGNVAGDSPKCRDLVLGHGALIPLLAQLNEHAKLSMLRNATWTLSNFCRGKPQPPFDQVCSFVIVFLFATVDNAYGILVFNNENFFKWLWLYSFLYSFLPMRFCYLPENMVFFLHLIEQVKPALPALAHLIHSNDEEVLTDACWALSYLSDGTNDKIQAVIEAGVCPRLVELLL